MNGNIVKRDSQGIIFDPTQLQSHTINLLRFPLALMVIFIHMSPHVVSISEAPYDLLSLEGINNILGILFSHVISAIAVPTFFLISGFLFFANFQEWSWSGYCRKMKSRVRTLIIPYFLWNALPFLLSLLCLLGGVLLKGNDINRVYDCITNNSWHIFYDIHEWGTTGTNWLGCHLRMTGPLDLPLWFLRDLIVLTTLSPLIYFCVKRLKIYSLIILFFAYISKIWTLLPGFSITAFFFFTIGTYFALNRINIVEFSNKHKIFLLSIYIILSAVATIYDGKNTTIGQYIMPIYICTGVFTAFLIASKCIERYNIMPRKILVSSCFFIYAFHLVGLPIIDAPLYTINRILHAVLPGDTEVENIICYLLSPFITALFCTLTLSFARNIAPKMTLLFSGNK